MVILKYKAMQRNKRMAWLVGISNPPDSRAQYTATLTTTLHALRPGIDQSSKAAFAKALLLKAN